MSGPTNPGSPPPEVPEEFAAAYRAAYERALAAQTVGQHRDDPEPPDETLAEEYEDTETVEQPLPRRSGPMRVGTHREPEEYDDDNPTWFENIRDSTWFVPLLLALLALLLILGAYAVGRGFAGQVDESPNKDVVVDSPDGEIQPFTNQKPGKGAWTGQGHAGSRTCGRRSPASGSPGRRRTATRSPTSRATSPTVWPTRPGAVAARRIGERITLKLGKTMPIGQVGLVPGYAKTDEQSNADRFAENNRVKRVRWTIGDTKVVQRFSGSPDDRNLQLLRVPKTRADTVVLEILAVKKGPRNKTAISEIQISRAG